jgi:hypothetical protein
MTRGSIISWACIKKGQFKDNTIDMIIIYLFELQIGVYPVAVVLQ